MRRRMAAKASSTRLAEPACFADDALNSTGDRNADGLRSKRFDSTPKIARKKWIGESQGRPTSGDDGRFLEFTD